MYVYCTEHILVVFFRHREYHDECDDLLYATWSHRSMAMRCDATRVRLCSILRAVDAKESIDGSLVERVISILRHSGKNSP